MKIICFISGKGGTGKTTLACNMAYALVDEGKQVLLFDADFYLSNTETVIGADIPCTIGHLVRDDRPIADALVTTEAGFDLIGGGTGMESLADLSDVKSTELLSEVATMGSTYDYVLIDAGPGLGPTVLACMGKADELIVVTTPDATGLTDAYAVVKFANEKFTELPICFVVNKVANESHGEKVANGLKSVFGQFLSREVRYLGGIRDDAVVEQALSESRLVVTDFVKSGASQDFFDVTYAFLRGGEADKVEEGNSVLDRIKSVFGKGSDSEDEVEEDSGLEDAA